MMKSLSVTVILILLLPCLASATSQCAKHYDPDSKTVVCKEVFDIFHKCTGQFLENALDTANPFRMCTDSKAHGFYRNLTFWLGILDKTHDPKNGNITCSDEYLNKNQMSVISHIVSTSKSLWETANCDECYVDTSLNQTFSDYTIAFNKSHHNYKACVDKYGRNSTAICKECVSFYVNLNELFDHEKARKSGKICFDLEDLMNKTRQEWSVGFKCCRDKQDSLIAFFSLFSTIMILAVIFYVTIYVTGSNYTEPITLDAAEIVNNSLNCPSTSSASSSADTRPVKVGKKNPSINNDDSDDETNILTDPAPAANLMDN